MKPKPAAAAFPPLPGEAKRSVPAWFPAWAREFAEQFFSGTTCLFLLHGNVHDLIWLPAAEDEGKDAGGTYGSLARFLATQMFGSWDAVLRYDLAQGLRVYAGSDAERHRKMASLLERWIGEAKLWPRDPDAALGLLDRLVDQILTAADPARPVSLGVIIEHAQYLVPSAELSQMGGPYATRLVRLLTWAQNPYIKRYNVAFCLLADLLAEVNARLTSSAHVGTHHVPMPDLAARERYAGWFDGRDKKVGNLTEFTTGQLAELTSGLSLVSLERLLAHAEQTGEKLDAASLRQLKKGLIEQQTRGLVEFVEPPHSLDDFVGNDAVKERLVGDVVLLSQGRLDVAPMGYLVCGPVGTGKTYLAECFAGSVRIPCVKLRNFRSKYVGETEGNLEQVLTVLRAMGPVLIVIDEADAALGTREAGGDSGTSSRVFSMVASQMGDTRYRGKLIWMLLTSRPDLLPIDLKRQGRAEVHLPLFSPRGEDEVRFMVRTMARKNKAPLASDAFAEGLAGRGLSGADIESIVLAARRRALTEARDELGRADLAAALADFIPSAQGLEKERQEIAAVLECTSMALLPEDWRARMALPEGRVKLQQRMAEIRRMSDD
jgi:SpoVK/Ycf46/Vps4 family AAA+-type ATPase